MLLTQALPTDSHVAPAISGARRLAGLDSARVVAVFAIVWIHTPRSAALQSTTTLGRFAVPFFVATTVLLIVKGLAEQPRRALLPYTRNRTRRLLLPFAAWTLIYGLLKLAKKWLAPQQPTDLPGWEAVFLGSAYHLWFLPFLWAVCLIAFPTARWVMARNRDEVAAAVALALGIALGLAPSPARSLPWEGVGFMWLALPAACWSLGLSLLWVRAADDFPGPALRSLAVVTLIVATLLLLSRHEREPLAEGLAGLSWLLLAISPSWANRMGPLGRLAPLTYGIYLAHLLFIKVGESIADRLQLPICPVADLTLFLIAAIGSICLAGWLSRHRSTRWLLG